VGAGEGLLRDIQGESCLRETLRRFGIAHGVSPFRRVYQLPDSRRPLAPLAPLSALPHSGVRESRAGRKPPPRRKLRADFDTEGLDGAGGAVLERFGRAVGDDTRKHKGA